MMRIEQRTEEERVDSPGGAMQWLLLSGESLLYVVILLAAAALRLAQLGYWPLLWSEATQAWGPWRLIQGGRPETLDYSPLLFSGNLFNFALFGASDAGARLWPALFGTLLVLLPYLLRDRLGRWGALAASLLLALSPSLLYFSRTLDGSIVAAAAALGLLVAIKGYVESRRREYVYGGAVALALGLMSGATFYTFLVALLGFTAYLALTARRGAESEERDALGAAWRELSGDKKLCLKAGGLVVGLVALVGSALFLNPSGIQATLNVLGEWLRLFSAGGGAAWYHYLILLATYETLPLLAGLFWLFFSLRKGDLLSTFLSVWFVLALLLHSIAGVRPANVLPIILLPLILLAAQAINRLIEKIHEAEIEAPNWLFVVLTALLLAFLYLQLAGLTVGGDTAYLRLAIVTAGVILLSFAIFWYWIGAEQAMPIGATTILGLLFLLFVHSTMELNYYTARDPREPLNGTVTSVDIGNVQPFLEDLSSRLEGDRTVMPILVEKSLHPLLSWYSRDFRTVGLVGGIPDAPEARAVIATAQEEEAGPKGFVGQPFRLRDRVDTQGLAWGDWLKWYLKRYEIGVKSSDNIEIWVKP